jgi:hypothetical protein
VYHLTDHGRTRLRNRIREILGQPEREYPNFPVALAESHNLPKDEVIQLLEGRIHAQELALRESVALEAWATEHDMPRRYWIEVQYTQAIIAAEVDFLRRMIVDLRGGDLPWQHFNPETGFPEPHDHEHLPKLPYAKTIDGTQF